MLRNGVSYDVVARTVLGTWAHYKRGILETVTDMDEPIRMQDWEPRVWQLALKLIVINEVNPREVLWIYDPIGNTGKTYFSRWAAAEIGALVCGNGRVLT